MSTTNVRDEIFSSEARNRTPETRPGLVRCEQSPELLSVMNKHLGEPRQRSPIKTRTESGIVLNKPVKLAVLKTMTNTDDEGTTISRPLTCEEGSKHKEVVGMMP